MLRASQSYTSLSEPKPRSACNFKPILHLHATNRNKYYSIWHPAVCLLSDHANGLYLRVIRMRQNLVPPRHNTHLSACLRLDFDEAVRRLVVEFIRELLVRNPDLRLDAEQQQVCKNQQTIIRKCTCTLCSERMDSPSMEIFCGLTLSISPLVSDNRPTM